MERIEFYLEKFRRFLPPGTAIKNSLKEIIKNKLGVAIDDQNIRISGRTVYLKLRPPLKTEIFLRREEILSELNEILAKHQANPPRQLV